MKFHMINTLTMDLVQTDLGDFCQHFEDVAQHRPHEILHDFPTSTLGKLDDVIFNDLPLERQRLIQLEGTTLVQIKRNTEGLIRRSYSLIAFHKLIFGVTVERYQRDRIRLRYEENLGPLRYANSFLKWLTTRWGTPIYHVNLDLNPILRKPPTEIGLTTIEVWISELRALGASNYRITTEYGISDSELDRHFQNIAIKVKQHFQIDWDLQAGELGELLRKLGHGPLS